MQGDTLAPSMPPWTRPADDPWILRQLEIERSEFVEPWRPMLGDRVRVKLNGECPIDHILDRSGEAGIVASMVTQGELDLDGPDSNGQRTTMDRGHFYGVEFDHPVSDLSKAFGMTWGYGSFAAAELEFVEHVEGWREMETR